jgi:NTE family protein
MVPAALVEHEVCRMKRTPTRRKGPGGAASAPAPTLTADTACTPEQIAARGARRPVNLALQGGGAHGAFTWGVLDRLLEDGTLALDAISATSAGAMNAVVMAHGVSLGGRDGARAKLEEFWRAVSRAGSMFSPLPSAMRGTPWETFFQANALGEDTGPAYLAFQTLTHTWSPYQLNPFDFNPLKDVLRSVVKFEHLQQCPHATRLFISATNVRSGKVRVFENAEVTMDAVLASACLPNVFKAVEIAGEHFWDGGFTGNPALFPLFYRGASPDIIIVHINPIERAELPTSAPEIFDRMNEISFNSCLLAELRAIAFVARLVDSGSIDAGRYKHMRIHSISDDKEMSQYGVASKLNPEWSFLCHLRDAGRAAASRWLRANGGKVGHAGSVELNTFL